MNGKTDDDGPFSKDLEFPVSSKAVTSAAAATAATSLDHDTGHDSKLLLLLL